MGFKPTAGEIANIWSFIIGNQANLCLLEHWLYHAEDEGLRNILQQSIKEAKRISEEGLTLYQKAGFPPPIGFSLEKDVIKEAPVLLSDKAIMFSMEILTEYGIYAYGLTIGKTETPEVISYYKTNLNNAIQLYVTIRELAKKSGYNNQTIYIPIPKQAENVKSHTFLAGWLGEQRPVTAMEIDNLVFSLRGVILAKTMLMVFFQVTKDPKVKKFCKRGVEICKKRIEKMQELNSNENLPFLSTFETEISNSITSPFSERLIMFQAVSLAQIAIARYGNALSFMSRRDLSSMFAMLIVETGTFLDDGLELMIENDWFEQPPLAADRK